jgi:hypothetical protein
VLIDLQSNGTVTRTDAFLLLLEAENHLLFREPEWHWTDDAELAAEIVSRAARTLASAMSRLRREAIPRPLLSYASPKSPTSSGIGESE